MTGRPSLQNVFSILSTYDNQRLSMQTIPEMPLISSNRISIANKKKDSVTNRKEFFL
jgi:hypothetical protein